MTKSRTTTGSAQLLAGRRFHQKVGTTRTLETVRDDDGQVTSRVRRTVLPGGLRVVTEQMAGARSASIGVWVGVGLARRDQRPCTAARTSSSTCSSRAPPSGRRSTSRSRWTRWAASSTPSPPRSTRASTRGCSTTTCRWRSTCSATWSPTRCSPSEDVEAERDVILDEIAMHDDDPDDVVHNLFAEQAWGSDSPLGRPIAGTVDSIAALNRTQVAPLLQAALPGRQHRGRGRRQRRAHRRRTPHAGRRSGATTSCPATRPPVPCARHGARRTVPARAGPGHPPAGAGQPGARHEGAHRAPTTAGSRSACSTPRWAAAPRAGCSRRSASAAAWPTPSSRSPATTPTPAWSASRSAACPARLDEVLETVRIELSRVAAHGITEEELHRGQGQLRGGLVLGLEDSSARMSRLGKAELVHDELLGIDEVLARIDAVTLDDVARGGRRGLRRARDPRDRRP